MKILITGGASGLGEAITRLLAQDLNAIVYFTYSKSKDSAENLENDYSNVFAIKCDFNSEEDLTLLKNKIAELDLDALINNAYSGDAIKTYFNKITPDEFLTGFKENIIPTVIITQAAITAFKKKKFGKIINILTSFLVNTPPLGSAVYVANKAYLQQLSKVWASENAKYNITSNAVSPSFMLTNFTADTDERILEEMQAKHPLKKILTTAEVAETVLFLVNSTQQINGVDILLNSGTNLK